MVIGVVPTRIEVRPSNGLGGSTHPDLESRDASLVNDKHATATES
jgi:hypothetical protein